jgi:hypothetical protein
MRYGHTNNYAIWGRYRTGILMYKETIEPSAHLESGLAITH